MDRRGRTGTSVPVEVIDRLLGAFRLKDEVRTGWLKRDVEKPESVASHSWGTALLCMLYGREAGVDVARAIEMALVHDLPEAEVGDIPRGSDVGKEALEKLAMEEVSLGETSKALWEEYRGGATPEASFVKDMDLCDMCLQALFYELEDRYPSEGDLREFFETSEPRLSTETGRRLFGEIEEIYAEAISR